MVYLARQRVTVHGFLKQNRSVTNVVTGDQVISIIHTSRMDSEPIDNPQRFVVCCDKLQLREVLVHWIRIPANEGNKSYYRMETSGRNEKIYLIKEYKNIYLSLSALGLFKYAAGLLLILAPMTSPWPMNIRPGTTLAWARSILWKIYRRLVSSQTFPFFLIYTS